jgi:hypothetical protein
MVRETPITRDAYNQGHSDKANGRTFNPPPAHYPSGDDTLGIWYRRGWEDAASNSPPRPALGRSFTPEKPDA